MPKRFLLATALMVVLVASPAYSSTSSLHRPFDSAWDNIEKKAAEKSSTSSSSSSGSTSSSSKTSSSQTSLGDKVFGNKGAETAGKLDPLGTGAINKLGKKIVGAGTNEQKKKRLEKKIDAVFGAAAVGYAIKKKKDAEKEASKNSSTTSSSSSSSSSSTVGVGAASTGSEEGKYHGRHNGDRPTWYFKSRMSKYPSSFYVTIPGCVTKQQVKNNGHRYTSGGLIVKQSDVSGRGMAIVMARSCKSKKASVSW